MRSIYLPTVMLLVMHGAQAQQIQVGANAQVTIAAGASFAAGGLKLNPSSSFTLNSLTIQTNTTVTHPFGNPYVLRVFEFNPAVPDFSGSVQINYLDGELNGLEKSSLQVIVYNGTAWQIAGTSASDVGTNNVLASGISNLSLSEMILASSLALPLTWGDVSAQRRQDASVSIRWSTEQEHNVSHFDVERSMDAVQWVTAISNIPARNQSYVLHYEQTDQPGYTGLLYYRIRQTDHDGRSTLSRTVQAAAGNSATLLAVLPNPANRYFAVTGVDVSNIMQVELFSTSGIRVQSWRGNQTRYNLPPLPTGTYYVRLQMRNGEMISKQVMIGK